MLEKLSAIILAGGESKRMGYNKEYIKINDNFLVHNQIKFLSKIFDEVIVVTNNPDHYKDLEVIVTKDILHGKTPLIGLHSGLVKSSYEYSFIIACDMPNINKDFIDYLLSKVNNQEAYLAKNNGYLEPFCAIYNKQIIPKIESFIANKQYGFQNLVNTLDAYFIEEEDLAMFLKDSDVFKNINREEDLIEKKISINSSSKEVTIKKIVNGKEFQTKDLVITEYPLSLFINGEYYITLMISPMHINHLIYGFLNAEMLIKNYKDVKELNINLENYRADVILENSNVKFNKYKSEFLSSACGASPKVKEKLDKTIIKNITNNTVLSSKEIFDNIQEFNHESMLFKETGGVHSVALVFNKTSKLFEDIGRHNAADKAIGYMMEKSIDSSDVYLLTSGRISSDILLKCALAKISIIISRSAPTSLSIKLAKELGITVVGFTRGNKMNIYSSPHRIRLDNMVK